MTGPDGARAQLAEALRDTDPIQPPDDLADYYPEADRLLPVVRRIVAAELRALGREALAETPGAQRVRIPVSDLFDRAATWETR